MASKRVSSRQSSKAALLIFSMPGVGKTSLIGTGKRTLIIRPPTDHIDPIRRAGNMSNIDDTVIHGWDELHPDGVFRGLQQGEYKNYDWVWWDSLTLFQDQGLSWLFDKAVIRNERRREFGLDKQEYGLNQFRTNRFIADMVGMVNDGLINFGVTAHTMEWYNPQLDANMWAPLIHGSDGKHMQKICGMMKTVGYYYLAKPEGKTPYRVLKTKTDKDDVFVKDQLEIGGESGRIKNPTMADINAALSSNNGSTTKRRPARRRRTRRSK